MKRGLTWILSIGLLLVAFAAGTSWSAAAPANADEAGVRRALDAYLQGHITGQAEQYRRGMHPDMRMSFVRDGKLVHRNLDEFASGATGKPAADEAKRTRRIVSIDITGTAAIAKIELDYPDVFFTDYMSLLKVDGEWRIVDKIFDRQPPRAAAKSSASE